MESVFTIIDLETTGLFPKRYDKITEVALKKVTQNGELIEEFITLVNPNRDLGPTSIHKISNVDITNAPTFEEINDYILNFINNTCLIGHNVQFDVNFLNYEINNRLENFEIQNENTLCTLKFATEKKLPRKLEAIQQLVRGNIENLHTAENDTEVIRELFINYELGHWIQKQKYSPLNFKIENQGEKIEVRRGEGIQKLRSFMEDLIFAANKQTPEFDDYSLNLYAELVEKSIEDKVVNNRELLEIQEFINAHNITDEDAQNINQQIFRNYCAVANSDFVITEDEKLELEIIGKLLSIDKELAQNLLQKVTSEGQKPKLLNENFSGKSVCFSGDINVEINGKIYTRNEIEWIAEEKNMILKSGVSKQLDLLVVADTQTQSGKAKKAREYDIRILSGNDFLNKVL